MRSVVEDYKRQRGLEKLAIFELITNLFFKFIHYSVFSFMYSILLSISAMMPELTTPTA